MEKNKEEYYEQATKKLLSKIDNMHLDKKNNIRTRAMTLVFRDSFKRPEVRTAVFDANTEKLFTYYSDGFCCISSINFARLMNNKQSNPIWSVMYIDDLWSYGPHHYLMHLPSQTIFDLTYDQYTNHGIEIAYELGKPLPEDIVQQEELDPAVINFARAIDLPSNE